MKKTVVSLSALALLTAVSPLAEKSNNPRLIACSIQRLPESAQHHRHTAAPRERIDESTSSNWSGYAAVSGTLASPKVNAVTSVSGYWQVPAVTGSAGQYSSLWVGLDGYADGTVEQLGTEQDVVAVKTGKKTSSTAQQNYTWFEMYPAGSFEISGFPTDVGDTIGAGVTYAGNNVYTLAITNVTRNVYYIVPVSSTTSSKGQRSSAEWVMEAPSMGKTLPLANFGTAGFVGCNATIGGTNGPISAFTYDDMIMATTGGTTKATPSALMDAGTTFTVTWSHQ